MVKGFRFAGINAGIKKNDKKDLGLIVSDRPAVIAGVTTRNKIFAAPVRYCREVLTRGEAQALLVNSGNANSFTGENGYKDCLEVTGALAPVLDIPAGKIAFTSTGIIGVPLPKDTIKQAFPRLKAELSDAPDNFSEAILTTDLTKKVITRTLTIQGKNVSLLGVAKGSGMISPNMATMLSFICTDIAIARNSLQELVSRVADETFNMISVDSDTSTNDMLLTLANGASTVVYEELSEAEQSVFAGTLKEVSQYLAKEIVKDGEGVSRVMEVTVSEARTQEEARQVVRSVIDSPLIKTAIHGADPNWGRFMMAVGKTCIEGISEDKVSLTIGTYTLVDKGKVLDFSRDEIKKYLQQKEIMINISLGLGQAEATGWGCDLTEGYIKINTAYN